ncbi:MAG: sugar phosphate nucleotidyltransferase [Pseudomonadota bacterium]
MQLDTVIFPVAGQGTRMLPATKAVPKELLPVYDTPLLQFAVDEALAAGARRLVFVSHRSKPALEAYMSRDAELEADLDAKGKTGPLADLMSTGASSDVQVIFTYQEAPLGLGHAVACAAPYVGQGPVGVILPDDLILNPGCLAAMADAYGQSGAKSLIAGMEVPINQVSRYGIFAAKAPHGDTIPATGLVEKPDPAVAPSRLAAIGRYVLSPDIF